MAEAIKLPKNVRPGKARVNMHWPEGLRRLPAEFGLMTSDLGFDEAELTKLANSNSDRALKIKNLTREVLLELMSRDTYEKQVESQSGKKVYFDHEGNPTTMKYSRHLTDSKGEFIEHEPALETRSRWGVRAGRETLTAPNAEMPSPGHIKTQVEEHFDDLFGQLKFRSKSPETKYVHDKDSRDAFLAAHANAIDDEGELRRALLEWLPGFLKSPKSKWNGED